MKQVEDGRLLTVDPENCSLIAQPTRIRPCSLRLCEGKRSLSAWMDCAILNNYECVNINQMMEWRQCSRYLFVLTDLSKPDPTILAQRKVYIQWRKGKKLQLVVGGYAYVLPWTPVVLRCPTRHFRKGYIQWLKDGRPLVGLQHLSITPQGSVKIQQVQASEAGIYTCIAGSAREHLVLQVIGSKQKLSAPELWHQKEEVRSQEPPVPLNQYDNIVEQLLKLKGSLQVEKDADDIVHSTLKNRGPSDDESSELSHLFVFTIDTHRLDEVMRRLFEGLGGPQGEQIIARLLSELATTRGETNESTLHPPERMESSTQGPLLYKPNGKERPLRPKRPVILQWPRKVDTTSPSDMIVNVGAPVFLQKTISSLELRCEALGNPDPSITWTKNGKKMHYNSR